MGYIYLLKQKNKNRCKVGKSDSLKQRLISLKSDWGEFDSDSLIFKFNLKKFDLLGLTAIEQYIHTILSFEGFHLKSKENFDGSTEMFKLENNNNKISDVVKKAFKNKAIEINTLKEYYSIIKPIHSKCKVAILENGCRLLGLRKQINH